MKEERIVNHLKRIAMGYPPFKVELKDFGKLSIAYHIYKCYKQITYSKF